MGKRWQRPVAMEEEAAGEKEEMEEQQQLGKLDEPCNFGDNIANTWTETWRLWMNKVAEEVGRNTLVHDTGEGEIKKEAKSSYVN